MFGIGCSLQGTSPCCQLFIYCCLFFFCPCFLSLFFFLLFLFIFFLFFFWGGGREWGEKREARGGSFVLFLQNFQKVPNVWYLIILKRADLRWNRRLEDMEQLTKLQDELLDAASMWDQSFSSFCWFMHRPIWGFYFLFLGKLSTGMRTDSL